MNERPTHIDLFSGILGFGLAAERAGFETIGCSEINPACCELIALRRPGIRNFGDVRRFTQWTRCQADLITGGDPCPTHSRARSNGESVHPDLSGYFLAVVARLSPGWVVRENVPAPTVQHFAAALDTLGYGVCVIRADAASFTAQSRQRDFIVGSHSISRKELARKLSSVCVNGPGAYETRLGARPVAPGLTTHRTRYDSRDCYIYEPSQLRILESEEREALAGFPAGWTAGFSAATRARMLGNSVVPAVAFEILSIIRLLL